MKLLHLTLIALFSWLFTLAACGDTSGSESSGSAHNGTSTEETSTDLSSTEDAVETVANPSTSVLPPNTQQAIVVLPAGWDDLQADIYLVEKSGKKWNKTAKARAVLGKNGSAWGMGLHESPAGERKKQEGDGRSPAGVFELGRCMGYAAEPSYAHDWPYVPLTKDHIGVDDPESEYYNQVINIQNVNLQGGALVFNSFEDMRRKDDLYKWLFEVKHNKENKPNAGSLIFLHLWRAADKGTAGCTAVEEPTMNQILNWVDESKNPVLIQMPKSVFDEKRKDWGLPKFKL